MKQMFLLRKKSASDLQKKKGGGRRGAKVRLAKKQEGERGGGLSDQQKNIFYKCLPRTPLPHGFEKRPRCLFVPFFLIFIFPFPFLFPLFLLFSIRYSSIPKTFFHRLFHRSSCAFMFPLLFFRWCSFLTKVKNNTIFIKIALVCTSNSISSTDLFSIILFYFTKSESQRPRGLHGIAVFFYQ